MAKGSTNGQPPREPESLERQFVRHVYGSDETLLPYRPASQEPRPRRTGSDAPIDRVLWALRAVGSEPQCYERRCDEWEAMCPAHLDERPSLVVRRNADGNVWLKCWAGCAKEQILDVLGLEWRDLFADSGRDRNALNALNALRGRRGLAPHLRRAMEQLLARESA